MLPEIRTSIPGPRSLELSERLRKVESHNITYIDADFPIFWKRAEGVNVWDVDGNRYLDFTSAFGVCGLGHGASEVKKAAIAQMNELVHAMGDVHPAEGKVLLCEKLSAMTYERWLGKKGKTILCNSGFEAVEAALKTACVATKRSGVLAFRDAYHGLGYGSLESSGMDMFRKPFFDQLGGFAVHVDFPRKTEELERIRMEMEMHLEKGSIGAVLVEPIQGRAGEVIPPDGFLRMLREVCDRFQACLIFDEIYTGFWRSGALFACDYEQVVPDIICLAKGLTAGFPLSACVARSEIMDAWPVSQGEALHTSTYLGHPVGCAMALAALNAYDGSDWGRIVKEKGDYFLHILREIGSPLIKEVRGRGLLIGVELYRSSHPNEENLAVPVSKAALKKGFIFLPGGATGNVLSFAPPFEMTKEELAEGGDFLREYLQDVR